jgi:aspartate ammonia-lyase
VLATSLAPYIGYENAADLVKECGNQPAKIRELVLQKQLLDQETLDKILNYRHEMTYLD